jgi:hypothetical protein
VHVRHLTTPASERANWVSGRGAERSIAEGEIGAAPGGS